MVDRYCQLRPVGQPLAREDAREKANGAAKYTADLRLPNMLYGKMLRSPHAHALVKNIDTSRALRLPGVMAVLTPKDVPAIKYGVFRSTRDTYPLAIDKARYVGDEVGAVAAIDAETALEALELIKVDYEPLPAVFDWEEAMAEGAPLVHAEVPRNLGLEIKIDYGDVERGFAEADYIRRDRFTTAAIGHAMLEPYSVLVDYQANGKVQVWVPNQSPFTRRRALANALRLSMDMVRVHRVYIGGAFGALSELYPADVCAALLSRKAGRPVRIDYSREEVFSYSRQKHPFTIEIATGVRADGSLLAKDITVWADGGAYYSVGPITITNPPMVFLGLFNVPNFRYHGYRVFTNNPVRGAMKGHGSQQLRFADGCQLDMIAEELQLDPAAIRRQNTVRSGNVTINGATITSCGIEECLDRATQAIGWERRQQLPAGRGMGLGIASMVCGYGMGFRTGAMAFIEMNEDGGATVLTGAQDCGQGNHSMMVQVAAQELGIPVGMVKLVAADSETTPQDPGAYSMTTAYVSANAVKRAAADARQRLLAIATEILGAPAEQLSITAGWIHVSQEEEGITVAQVVRHGLYRGRPVMGQGYWRPAIIDVDWVNGKIDGQVCGAFSYGAVAVEVDVDLETGQVQVLRVEAAHDCGKAINPLAVQGQIEGSIGFGLGQALGEGFAWDHGQVLNPDFLGYQMPIAAGMPAIGAHIVEAEDPEGPFGAKEAAETVGIAVIPAVVNAIYQAAGVWITDLPVTPERVLQALAKKK